MYVVEGFCVVAGQPVYCRRFRCGGWSACRLQKIFVCGWSACTVKEKVTRWLVSLQGEEEVNEVAGQPESWRRC